ncbi:hypothetical protein Trydic_g2923 [Trypoxylus dichotomus]
MFVENKVAIITGGATGIGYLYAVELLKNGLRAVVLADTNVTKGNEAVAQLTNEFGDDKALFIKTDVTDRDQVENVFKQTVQRYQNIDILVNNAGILNESVWEKEIAINLNGTVYGCLLGMEEYLPKYRSEDEAVIVNISSIAGLDAFASSPVYTATKHAIIGLSRCLGTPDHYDTLKVRILTICPGVTNTPLMENLGNKMFNERYTGVLTAIAKNGLPVAQNPEDVAQILVKVIEKGSNGSFWIIEGGELDEVEIPERNELKKNNKRKAIYQTTPGTYRSVKSDNRKRWTPTRMPLLGTRAIVNQIPRDRLARTVGDPVETPIRNHT